MNSSVRLPGNVVIVGNHDNVCSKLYCSPGRAASGIIQASDGDADVGPFDQVVGQRGAARRAELTLDQAGGAGRSRPAPCPAQSGFPDPRECHDRSPRSLLAHAAVANTRMVGGARELIAHAAALTPSGEAHVIPISHVDLVCCPARLIIAHAAARRSETPVLESPHCPMAGPRLRP